MKSVGTWKLLTVLTVGLALLIAACGGYGSAASGGPASGTIPPGNTVSSGASAQGTSQNNSGQLTLSIASPANGATVSIPFEIKLKSNVRLADSSTGEHHVHLYYDTKTPTGAYDLVYGNTFMVKALKPGKHTILASLRNADHSDAGPSQIITVTVTGSGNGSTGDGGTGGTNGNGGGGYNYGGGY